MESPVRVYCFGHFHIEWPGAVAPSESAQLKPLALLKVLIALGGQHVPQDRLIDSLWPDSEGDAGQTAFNTTLYRLRRFLGQNAAILRNRQLSLDLAHVWWDVGEFEQVSSQSGDTGGQIPGTDVDRLLALYRGPFLDGEFDPPEIMVARERLQGRFLRCIRAAGTALEQAGQFDAAVDLYGRALEREPGTEALRQHLIRAQAVLRARHTPVKAAMATAQAAVVVPDQDCALNRSDAVEPRSGMADGVERTHAAALQPVLDVSKFQKTRAPMAWVGGAVVAVALVLAALGLSRQGGADDPQVRARSDSALQVPSEPSIVVLPFSTMSGTAEHGYFAEGLTDTLITDLSQLHKILVIGSNSSFAYKDKPIDVRQVGRELGVRHVLQGSIQTSNNRVRINVQLIEAETGAQVWAERYDRPLQDIFGIQDDIASRIVEELDVALVTGEQAREWRRMTKNPAAYSETLAGRAIQGVNHSIDGMIRSRAHFRRAIELDPDFALPYAYMVSVYQHMTDSGYDAEPDVTYETALKYADRAVELNPKLAIARAYRGAILQQVRRYEESLREYRLAVQYGPNSAESLMLSAWGMAAVGDANEALPIALRAMRLDPIMPGWYWGGLADVYLRLQRWEESIPMFERCLQESVDLIWCRAGLTVAHVRMGDEVGVQRSVREWRRIDPEVKAQDNFYLIAWGDPAFRRILEASLKEAGL